MGTLNEISEHRFRDLEVGDHTVLDRTDRFDIPWRASEHFLGSMSDRAHSLGAPAALPSHSDHAGLRADDAVPFAVDQRICGSEVDREIVREHSGNSVEKHPNLQGARGGEPHPSL